MERGTGGEKRGQGMRSSAHIHIRDKRRGKVYNRYRLPLIGVTSTRAQPRSAYLVKEQQRSRKHLLELLREAFLPEGYPHTVSADYARYQVFDSMQAFCSSVTGLL